MQIKLPVYANTLQQANPHVHAEPLPQLLAPAALLLAPVVPVPNQGQQQQQVQRIQWMLAKARIKLPESVAPFPDPFP